MNIPAAIVKTTALLALLLLSCAAQADLTSGSVSNLSATRNIPYSSPSSVSIRWTMLRIGTAGAPGIMVSSLSGRFTNAADTVVLGTVAKTLSRSIPLGGGDTFIFNETVRIPRDVLLKAFQQNINTIVYRRDFTDCPAPSCSATFPLNISYSATGSTAGAFSVADYVLRFGDGSLATIVDEGKTLQAEARINVNGSGVIRGMWEVATPDSTGGQPFFQSVQMITRQVSSGQTIRLRSPDLPVKQTGSYLVRFRFLEPELSEEPPVLQYVVRQTQQPKLPEVTATGPASNASINADSTFQWQAVANASSYKLEIVDGKPEQGAYHVIPVTGIWIKGESTQTSLTGSLMKKLITGRDYWWHVVALDASGKMIAASDWRRIIIEK